VETAGMSDAERKAECEAAPGCRWDGETESKLATDYEDLFNKKGKKAPFVNRCALSLCRIVALSHCRFVALSHCRTVALYYCSSALHQVCEEIRCLYF
jgi:hypothetical protein